MKQVHGFTLIEIAVTLIIVGLIIGSLFGPLSVQVDHRKVQITQNRLETIKEALLGFAIVRSFLPCPATNNVQGTEDEDACDEEGYLPWVDLGLDEARKDGWGRPFRYRIGRNYKQLFDNPLRPEEHLAIQTLPVPPDDPITISSTKPDPLDSTVNLSQVVVIIFSCGKNGRPDPNPQTKLANSDTNDADGIFDTNSYCNNPGADTIYVQDSIRENEFDDILTWISENTLVSRLALANKWPP